LLSRDAVAAELAAGLVGEIAVDGRPAPRQWHAIRLAVGPARPVVDEFLAFVRGAGQVTGLLPGALPGTRPG
jgi:hypothetical protein